MESDIKGRDKLEGLLGSLINSNPPYREKIWNKILKLYDSKHEKQDKEILTLNRLKEIKEEYYNIWKCWCKIFPLHMSKLESRIDMLKLLIKECETGIKIKHFKDNMVKDKNLNQNNKPNDELNKNKCKSCGGSGNLWINGLHGREIIDCGCQDKKD